MRAAAGNRRDYFGVNVSLAFVRPEELELFIQRIAELGVGWVRLELDWYRKLDLGMHDRFVKAMASRNIRILGLLSGIVPANTINLLFPGLKFKSPTDNKKEYLTFVRKMCRRYSRYVQHWEVWNEENTRRFWIKEPDAESYIDLLEMAIDNIRKINPKAKIVTGGVCGNDVDFMLLAKRGFVAAVEGSRLRKKVDGYGFHPYIGSCYVELFKRKEAYVKEAEEEMAHFIERYGKSGKELWATEWGISKVLTFSIGYEEIGWIYSRLLDYACEKKVRLFFWTMMDMNSGDYSLLNPERYFGLLDSRLGKKASYLALAGHAGKKSD
jgi:beta-xylosidase